MTVRRQRFLALAVGLGLALASVGAASASANAYGAVNAEKFMPIRGQANGHGRPTRSNNLSFHGGSPGVVTGSDKVFLVFWGSGWSSDPSGEAALLGSFFGKVGGSGWNNSVTQYCDTIASGTVTCGSNGRHAVNPSGSLVGGTWNDTANAAPSSPTQSDLAGEAQRAAAHFAALGPVNQTTVQYVIATATGHNSSGFGTQFCAWHSSTGSSLGTLAYTNLPYITDAGASCGANFNNLGPKAGITIVEGHEFAETETDIFPNGGWLDRNGAENGDKCAWISSGQGASASVPLGGSSFPVQSLWSNAFNSGAGGCVLSY
jgi:serine protease